MVQIVPFTPSQEIYVKSGTKVLSLDKGYFRPGYISLEKGGNNASSPIAGLLPEVDEVLGSISLDPKELDLISKIVFATNVGMDLVIIFGANSSLLGSKENYFIKI